MYKIIKFTTIVCVALLLLTGCAPKDDFADYEFVEPPVMEGVTAQTEFPEYDGDTETIYVIVTNDRDEKLHFGETFYLQKKDNGEWRPIKVEGGLIISRIRALPAHSVGRDPVILKDKVKLPLLPGEYRVWVGDTETDKMVSAEFTVK